jgi:hypothetical protein
MGKEARAVYEISRYESSSRKNVPTTFNRKIGLKNNGLSRQAKNAANHCRGGSRQGILNAVESKFSGEPRIK